MSDIGKDRAGRRKREKEYRADTGGSASSSAGGKKKTKSESATLAPADHTEQPKDPLGALKELFQDWDDEDLSALLVDVANDVDRAVVLITEGLVTKSVRVKSRKEAREQKEQELKEIQRQKRAQRRENTKETKPNREAPKSAAASGTGAAKSSGNPKASAQSANTHPVTPQPQKQPSAASAPGNVPPSSSSSSTSTNKPAAPAATKSTTMSWADKLKESLRAEAERSAAASQKAQPQEAQPASKPPQASGASAGQSTSAAPTSGEKAPSNSKGAAQAAEPNQNGKASKQKTPASSEKSSGKSSEQNGENNGDDQNEKRRQKKGKTPNDVAKQLKKLELPTAPAADVKKSKNGGLAEKKNKGKNAADAAEEESSDSKGASQASESTEKRTQEHQQQTKKPQAPSQQDASQQEAPQQFTQPQAPQQAYQQQQNFQNAGSSYPKQGMQNQYGEMQPQMMPFPLMSPYNMPQFTQMQHLMPQYPMAQPTQGQQSYGYHPMGAGGIPAMQGASTAQPGATPVHANMPIYPQAMQMNPQLAQPHYAQMPTQSSGVSSGQSGQQQQQYAEYPLAAGNSFGPGGYVRGYEYNFDQMQCMPMYFNPMYAPQPMPLQMQQQQSESSAPQQKGMPWQGQYNPSSYDPSRQWSEYQQ